MDLIVFGRGATLIEKPIKNSNGRIVFGDIFAVITLNSDIEYQDKKRFTFAHELGHFKMHRNLIAIHNDTDATIEFFKKGHQETEANKFASELLMPKSLFKNDSKGKKFSPDLLRKLSNRFQTSFTSTAFRYFKLGDYPICSFYSHKNKVGYWKRPDDYPHFINDRTRLFPSEDSVAGKFFNEANIYSKEQSKQQIWKSTWFELIFENKILILTFVKICIPSIVVC